jgi:hypothetical protein
MLTQFISQMCVEWARLGYCVGDPGCVPGVQALLYIFSPQRKRMGFANVEEHFLFVDWENAAFGRIEYLKDFYTNFSKMVNRRFPVAHALRLQIPSLVITAISPDPFPAEAAQFVRCSNLTPWYGGETAQIILVSIRKRQVISQVTSSLRLHPIPGAIPLGHAVNIIRATCQASFPTAIAEDNQNKGI